MSKHYDSFGAGPEWGTPEHLIETFEEHCGERPFFDLDPASGAEERRYARQFYALRPPEWWNSTDAFVPIDGTDEPWFGHVWVNPPYGREFNADWAETIHEQAQRDAVDSVTALVPAATETNYWHDHYWKADRVTFLDGRLTFIDSDPDEGDREHGATFPNAIVTYGFFDLPAGYGGALNELGQVVDPIG